MLQNLENLRHEFARGKSTIAGITVLDCTLVKQIVSSSSSQIGTHDKNTCMVECMPCVADRPTSVVGTTVGFSDPFVRRLNSIRLTLQSFDKAARQRLAQLNDRLSQAESRLQQLQQVKTFS